MAVFEVKSPTGEVYEITAPENANEQEVLVYAQKQFASKETPSVTTVAQENKPVESPSLVEQVNPANSPLFQKFTAPGVPGKERVSPTNILIGTGIGAGTGFLYGGFPGAVVGGTGGLVGSTAAEISKARGGSEAEQLLANIFGGGIGDLTLRYGAKTVASVLPKLPYVNVTKNLENEFVANKAALKSKEKVFGKPTFAGMATTETSDALQNDLIRRTGITVNEGEKVSDVIRKGIYEDIGKSTPFVKSPEYQELMTDLGALLKRPGKATEGAIKDMNQILRNQADPDPLIAKTAAEDINNLIQRKGSYNLEGETKTLISSEMQNSLRDKFNKYLERVTSKSVDGNKVGYNYLKDIERQEFIAQAKDSIPTILNTNFRTGTPEYKSAVETLQNTTEGRALFADAVKQHFYNMGKVAGELPTKVKVSPVAGAKEVGLNVDPTKLTNELNRIYPALKENGLMTTETYNQLRQSIAKLPKEVTGVKRWQTINELIANSIAVPVATQVFTM